MLGRLGRSSVGMFIHHKAGFRGENKYEPLSLPLLLCTLGCDEKDGPVGLEPFCAVIASEAVGPALGVGAEGSTLRILWVCGERVGYSGRPPVGSRETQPSHMAPGHPQTDAQCGAKGRQVFVTRHSWPLGGPLVFPPWGPRPVEQEGGPGSAAPASRCIPHPAGGPGLQGSDGSERPPQVPFESTHVIIMTALQWKILEVAGILAASGSGAPLKLSNSGGQHLPVVILQASSPTNLSPLKDPEGLFP